MMSILLAHLIGDYFLQSHWMAIEKTKRSFPALLHVMTYGLPFLLLQPSLICWFTIIGTHFLIDRYRLARFICYAKNYIAPPSSWPKSWSECSSTGFDPAVPAWLSVWLMIVVDQTLHLGIAFLAFKYLQ